MGAGPGIQISSSARMFMLGHSMGRSADCRQAPIHSIPPLLSRFYEKDELPMALQLGSCTSQVPTLLGPLVPWGP